MVFPLMFSPFDEAFGSKARQTSVSPEDSKSRPFASRQSQLGVKGR